MFESRNRIARYYDASDPMVRLECAERDLAFVRVMVQLGFPYSTSATRIVNFAAHVKTVARSELRK